MHIELPGKSSRDMAKATQASVSKMPAFVHSLSLSQAIAHSFSSECSALNSIASVLKAFG